MPRLFEAQRDPWRGWMDAPLWPSFLGGHGATPAGDEGPWGGLRDRWKGFAKYLRYRRPESLAHWGQSRASTAPILGLGEGPHGRYHCLDGLSSPANWRTAIPYRRWSTGDNESLKPAGTKTVSGHTYKHCQVRHSTAHARVPHQTSTNHGSTSHSPPARGPRSASTSLQPASQLFLILLQEQTPCTAAVRPLPAATQRCNGLTGRR